LYRKRRTGSRVAELLTFPAALDYAEPPSPIRRRVCRLAWRDRKRFIDQLANRPNVIVMI